MPLLNFLKNKGFFAYWRGNLVNCIRYFPIHFLKYLCRYNPQKEKLVLFFESMATGCAAGAASLGVVYPLDFAKTRLATDVGKAA